jgi:hypothetical protein
LPRSEAILRISVRPPKPGVFLTTLSKRTEIRKKVCARTKKMPRRRNL